ncbi:Tyrosine-protein kinase Fer [Orchesella cincta]|uniref:Tyrosine-protein kinase Fer n=1 Tax=Orchesella cincta TaxID=48709 RepID=A0A1D2M6B4_ORCCI|nr:Tyrosine-protein kinase Fer [Orchesella cincta]
MIPLKFLFLSLWGLFLVKAEVGLSVETGSSKLIFDVTKQLKRVLSKDLSITEFITTMESHIIECNMATNVSLLYWTDCAVVAFNHCNEEIREVAHLVNTTIGKSTRINLLISLTLYFDTLHKLAATENATKIQLSDIPVDILLNINVDNDINCTSLEFIDNKSVIHDVLWYTDNWISRCPASRLGLGYTEKTAKNCVATVDTALKKNLYSMDFLVLNLQLGRTVGVVESFGLFRKQMNALQTSNIYFIQTNVDYQVQSPESKPGFNAVYYPSPGDVGDESHRRLLLSYAKFWTSENTQYKPVMIIPAPYFEDVKVANFSVVARFTSQSCLSDDEELLEWKETAIQNVKWYELQHWVQSSNILIQLSYRLFDLWLEPQPFDYKYFEHEIRFPTLEGAERVRNMIVTLHPELEVYLQINVNNNFWVQKLNRGYKVTAFCDEEVLQANIYFEAILNWSKLKNFPVILSNALDMFVSPTVLSWLTLLRPLDLSSNESSTELHPVAADYPLFVLRNFPIGLHNWKVDPCIERDKVPPKVTSNYFHNNYVGAIFHFPQHKNDALQRSNEVMLQFVLNRFQYVEMVTGLDGRDIRDSLEKLNENELIKSNQTFLVCFEVANSDRLHVTFSNFVALINSLKIMAIKGVHLEFLNTSTANIEIDGMHGEFGLVTNKLRKLDIDLGILIHSTTCLDLIQYLIYSTPQSKSISNLLNKVNYIICKDKLDVRGKSDINYLAGLLDTHLYISRAYQELYPAIKMYFRVELLTELNSKPINMDPYLKYVSYFMDFATAYDIKYFLVEAFDDESGDQKNGWWGIKDFTSLADPYNYFEKESVLESSMWYPPVPPNSGRKTTASYAIVASTTSLLLVLSLAAGVKLYMRFRELGKYLSPKEVEDFRKGLSLQMRKNLDGNEAEIIALAAAVTFNASDELSILDLNIDAKRVLGFGNFGTVYGGTAKGRPAAIKTPNKDCPKAAFKSLLDEVKVLSYMDPHPCIVEFLGAYIKELSKGILYIATELCSNGSLEGYLRKKTHVASRQVVSYARRHVIGDLTARNVFLDERLTCKVGDFGLSHKLYEYQVYVKKDSQEVIPWKWMAYESLSKMEFTSKSDMWSYGVLLSEIYSLGCTPYGGLNWNKDFITQLRNGLRLSRPEFATEEIYVKMQATWDLDADQRPTFSEMTEFFKPFCYSEYTEMEATI